MYVQYNMCIYIIFVFVCICIYHSVLFDGCSRFLAGFQNAAVWYAAGCVPQGVHFPVPKKRKGMGSKLFSVEQGFG